MIRRLPTQFSGQASNRWIDQHTSRSNSSKFAGVAASPGDPGALWNIFGRSPDAVGVPPAEDPSSAEEFLAGDPNILGEKLEKDGVS